MKWNKLNTIALLIFLTSLQTVKAQDNLMAENTMGLTGTDKDKETIRSFNARAAEGKAYLNWIVEGQTTDGLYFILRSNGNGEFILAGFVKGIGVPIQEPIAYYFVDNDPGKGEVTYRLVYVNSDEVNASKPDALISASNVKGSEIRVISP